MLTQLATVKARLAIAPADITHDALLTAVIGAVSRRFEAETRREFARTVNATHEFRADDRHVLPPCLPIESVHQFEIKSSEAAGWEPRSPTFLLRRRCTLMLADPLGFSELLARVTYTGGYVLPGDPDPPGNGLPPVRLPADLEHAAVEQTAAWYQLRDKLGLVRHWPNSGTYDVLSQQPFLPVVTLTLRRYEFWEL